MKMATIYISSLLFLTVFINTVYDDDPLYHGLFKCPLYFVEIVVFSGNSFFSSIFLIEIEFVNPVFFLLFSISSVVCL